MPIPKKTTRRGPSVIELLHQFSSKEKCIKFLEKLRWPDDQPECPRCNSKSTFPVRTRLIHQCKKCRYQFSVMVGTIFHRSHLPLQKWIVAIALMANAKKGISAKQIERDLDVTYKTAWYLMHRIRTAMRETSFLKKFTGIVELDETFIGGKPRRENQRWDVDHTGNIVSTRRGHKDKLKNKSIVMGIRERGGHIRTEIIKDRSSEILCSIVRANVNVNADSLYADELSAYNQLANDYRMGRVNHQYEYANGHIHINSVESFWAILKRGVIGSFHKVSKKYLPLYLDEFTYRFNHGRNGNGVDLWKDILSNAVIYNKDRSAAADSKG